MLLEILRLVLYAVGFLVFLVLSQDLHIFPGAFLSKVMLFPQHCKKVPQEVRSSFVRTEDGKRLELWRYEADEQTVLSKYRALIFHGNGASLESFVFVQMWLASLGIVSYSFDYRGYGRSTGWPSEKGFALDSDAIWKHITTTEAVNPSHTIVVGISIGSASAARIAALHGARLLILSSPFTDLRSAVRAQPFVGMLSSFVRYSFSTVDYVRQLTQTDLIILHGLKDRIIPPCQAVHLQNAYAGSGQLRRLVSEIGGHNSAFYLLREPLRAVLERWL